MSSNKDMTDKEITILEEALFRSGGNTILSSGQNVINRPSSDRFAFVYEIHALAGEYGIRMRSGRSRKCASFAVNRLVSFLGQTEKRTISSRE